MSLAIGRIKAGLDKDVYLGNLDAARDWGYAREYVEGMWKMLQAPEPSDYVPATERDDERYPTTVEGSVRLIDSY